MVSVLQVYNTLKDLANKDQKGFITPAVFNNFTNVAQINIYNELFQELVKARQIQRQNFDPGRDKSVRKQVKEDLSYFVVSDLEISGEDTIFFKPDNLSKIISISTSDSERAGVDYEDGEYTRKQVELVYDVEEIDRILTSNLSTPTESFPVALITQDIEIFPTSITNIRLTYYRLPGSIRESDGSFVDSSPAYTEVSIGGVIVFSPLNSLNFMLPSHYLTELVMEMAKLIGVRLRDPNIVGFASQEEASE